MEVARRAMRPPLRRRFYETSRVAEGEGGFAVVLDGKLVRTPAGQGLYLPSKLLAEAVAAEWQAQAEFIDPVTMPLTRLAHSVIDRVVPAPGRALAEINKYLACDLVFYRAERPEELVARQMRHWDPIIAWAREELGADFVVAKGIVHMRQPDSALQSAATAIPGDPWRLGAVHSITTLTGSALIALAVAGRQLVTEQAWAAAHVDEDWNIEQWGSDALALERRSFGLAGMHAAATVLSLVGAG